MVVKVRIRFLSLGLHILIMLAVAVLAVVILFFWLDHYTRHGDVAEVPMSAGCIISMPISLYRKGACARR